MSAPRWQEPNLAAAPFVNERPVRRLAAVLWVLFAIGAASAFWMARTIRTETGSRVAGLARLSTDTVSARARAVALEAELRKADLPAQNVRAEFLNRRIAERSFSWNRLLETLTREMPRGVRLLRLSPTGFNRQGAGRAATVDATTRVALRISGEAEDTESLLDFVDRLFRHPAFDKPNLARESGKKDLKIQFELSVDYLPQLAEASAASPELAEATSPGLPAGKGGVLVAKEPAGKPASAASAGVAAGSKPANGLAASATAGEAPSGGAAAADKTAAEAKELARAAAGLAPWPPGAPAGGRAKETARPAVHDAWGGGDDASNVSGRAGSTPVEGEIDAETGRPVARPGNRGGDGSSTGGAPAGGEKRFPFNVLPTPLQPYASGGNRQ